jgi:hypothetical protein
MEISQSQGWLTWERKKQNGALKHQRKKRKNKNGKMYVSNISYKLSAANWLYGRIYIEWFI